MSLLHFEDTFDCLSEGFFANDLDSIVTDPPYGLGSWDWIKDHEDLTDWHQRWAKQALRVVKPGGHMLVFSGTRHFHHMMIAVEQAGWELRDTLMWVKGGGFPKSQASLKPAWEPIALFRKKPEGSIKANYAKYGVGWLNIGECGIPANDKQKFPEGDYGSRGLYGKDGDRTGDKDPTKRWPANVILDEEAAAQMDEQSGTLKSNSGGPVNRKTQTHNTYGSFAQHDSPGYHGDEGGASRFFYCAKASPKERNEGMVEGKNDWSTVKPVAVMEWLIQLVTPEGGKTLDPFMGSGTTGVAAANVGRHFIGIENDLDAYNIAKQRIEYADQQAEKRLAQVRRHRQSP